MVGCDKLNCARDSSQQRELEGERKSERCMKTMSDQRLCYSLLYIYIYIYISACYMPIVKSLVNLLSYGHLAWSQTPKTDFLEKRPIFVDPCCSAFL